MQQQQQLCRGDLPNTHPQHLRLAAHLLLQRQQP
jgi:hypothetical protein